jgi:archaellum component FlaC
MRQAKGIEEFDEIEGLERRYKVLEDQLRKLNGEGPGFRQDVKAEIEQVADDLTGMVKEFVTLVDSGYRPDQQPMHLHKS